MKPNSWNNQTTGEATYRGNLEDINAIIARMVDDVIGAGAFADIKDPYNFQQARNLTNETVRVKDRKEVCAIWHGVILAVF